VSVGEAVAANGHAEDQLKAVTFANDERVVGARDTHLRPNVAYDSPQPSDEMVAEAPDKQGGEELSSPSRSHVRDGRDQLEMNEPSSSDRATPSLQRVIRPFGYEFQFLARQ
jgi:hypothetical protein